MKEWNLNGLLYFSSIFLFLLLLLRKYCLLLLVLTCSLSFSWSASLSHLVSWTSSLAHSSRRYFLSEKKGGSSQSVVLMPCFVSFPDWLGNEQCLVIQLTGKGMSLRWSKGSVNTWDSTDMLDWRFCRETAIQEQQENRKQEKEEE